MNNWKSIEFLDSIQKISNSKKIPKKEFLGNGSYPIISQEDEYINGFWDNPEDVFKVKKPVIIFGDHTKKLKYINFDFVLGADGVKILLPIEDIDSKFFYYQLKSLNIKDLGYARHYRLLKEKKIKYPKIEQQKQIVEILDKVFESIDRAKENIEKNIENSKELFQSRLNEIFSQKGEDWEEKTLGEVCNIIGGGTPSKSINEYYNGDILWATVRDMKTDKLNDTELKITDLGLNKSSSNLIPKGHVIIATRVGLGKVCLLDNDTAINQDLKGIVPKKEYKILNKFIFWWFKSIAHNIVSAGTGATVHGVKLPFIKSLVFPYMSVEKQSKIIDTLDKLNEQTKQLEEHYKQKLQNLEELKKSVLQKAFSGKLIE